MVNLCRMFPSRGTLTTNICLVVTLASIFLVSRLLVNTMKEDKIQCVQSI